MQCIPRKDGSKDNRVLKIGMEMDSSWPIHEYENEMPISSKPTR